MDAAHFVFAPFLGFLWCLTRVFIPSPTGRKRFNVLGALNAVTKEIITVTNQSYINAESVCQLLLTIAQMNIKTPITIVLDNARYQRCELVQECARQLGIELLFLPAYSPHLNLIERYWKFVKKTCLYSKYYADFNAFKDAIQTCVETSHHKYYDELCSLLTLKFQSFEKIKIAQI